MIVTGSALTVVHRKPIVALAARYKLPAGYFARYFVEEGGLLSYGPDFTDGYRKAADYVDRILRGAKPGELPVQAPSKYDLVINATKWVEFLKRIAPATTRAAVLRDSASSSGIGQWAAIQTAVPSLGIELIRSMWPIWAKSSDRSGCSHTRPMMHDRDGKCFNRGSPQANRCAGGPIQIAGGLFRTLLCRGRWFALLWA
jgi:ABC transporter substrate binding protein